MLVMHINISGMLNSLILEEGEAKTLGKFFYFKKSMGVYLRSTMEFFSI